MGGCSGFLLPPVTRAWQHAPAPPGPAQDWTWRGSPWKMKWPRPKRKGAPLSSLLPEPLTHHQGRSACGRELKLQIQGTSHLVTKPSINLPAAVTSTPVGEA